MRDVRSLPVRGEDLSVRGWVRLDADRVTRPNATEFCITVDTSSYLSPFEARGFAGALIEQADEAERIAALSDKRANAR